MIHFRKEDFKFRLLKKEELDELSVLIEEAFSLKANPTFFWNALSETRRSLVVSVCDQLVGHVLVTTLVDAVRRVSFYRLDYVCVKEGYRCHGIGSFMLEQVEQMAQEEDISWIEFTSGNRRVEAHQFYHDNCYQVRDTAVFQKNIE